MELLTRLGGASPLCVIKDCGEQGKGLLSFPMEGTSIAVDMAVSPDIQRIVDSLNEFVIAAGGRIYLTKDRFTRADHFRAMEPRLPSFLAAREAWDPGRRLRSAQSVRLFGDRAWRQSSSVARAGWDGRSRSAWRSEGAPCSPWASARTIWRGAPRTCKFVTPTR